MYYKLVKNIALAGYGYWGKNLARNLYNLGVLRAICEPDEDKQDSARQNCPDVLLKSSFGDLLNDRELEAVVIATPASTHFELGKEALLARKDIFVEKPLALNIKEAEELIKLAMEKKKLLMVDHILQYHPAVTKLKELIKSGELGKIQYIYSNRLNMGKIRKEENILWSFAPHDISLILSIVGRLPEEVVSYGGVYLQHNIEDVTITFMRFPNGTAAHIFVNWLNPFKEQKFVVVGDKRMAVFDDMSESKLLLYPHKIHWREGVPTATKVQPEPVSVDNREPLEESCRHFIECVKNREKPRTDGEEGLRVLKVLQLAQSSLDSAKK